MSFAFAGHAFAGEPVNQEEERLRVALRQATEQLRSAQSDLAALQATQAAADQERKDLKAKNDALTKASSAEKQSDDQKIAKLERELEASTIDNTRLRQRLGDASTAWTRTEDKLKAMTGQRDQLAAENSAQQRRIISLKAKNVALFLAGNDILRRYQDFGFGSALKAKEPFVGSTRARLETLVQDFQDRLLDARDQQ